VKVTFDLVLKPHPLISAEIDLFKRKHQLDSHEVIAMQIRRGTPETSFVPIASEKEELMFWTCAKKYATTEQVDTK
jgi:hypothetical protein